VSRPNCFRIGAPKAPHLCPFFQGRPQRGLARTATYFESTLMILPPGTRHPIVLLVFPLLLAGGACFCLLALAQQRPPQE
jgi:hypothetical protein